MKKTNKKGFTIVELVIVIAVVAILAAVLIPTFSNLVKKANLSSDQVAVRNMNTALKTSEVDGKPQNLYDVRQVLVANGFNADKNMIPVSSGYAFLWNSEKNEMMLVDEGKNVVYPEDCKGITFEKTSMFDISFPAAKVTDTGAKEVQISDDGTKIPLDSSFIFGYDDEDGKNEYVQKLRLKALDEATKSEYADWRVDFVISFDKEIKLEEEQTYLAGQYTRHGGNWVKFAAPTGMTSVPAKERIKLVHTMFDGKWDSTFTYGTIYDYVQFFNCGVYNSNAENKGATMTVELCLFDPADEENYIVVYAYRYTF